MLLSVYTTLVISNFQNKVTKKDFETDMSCLIQVYIDFHRQKNTLNTANVQNELIELLKKLFVLQENPKAPANFDLSNAVTQIKEVIQIKGETIEDFQKLKKAPLLLNILTSNTNNPITIENKKEKYAYALLLFGFEGFEFYLQELLDLPMKQIHQVKTTLTKYESISNQNINVLKIVLNLILTFEQVFEAKNSYFQTRIPFKRTEFILSTDAISSLVLSNHQDLPITTTLLLLETLLSKSKNRAKTINAVLFGAGLHLRDDVTIEITKRFQEANPFQEDSDFCALTLTTTVPKRVALFNAFKQNNVKNHNENLFSIIPFLSKAASKNLIAQLMMIAIDIKDYRLLEELTSFKQEWDKFHFQIDDTLGISQRTEFEFINPNNTAELIKVPNPQEKTLNIMLYAVFKNDPIALEILSRDPKRFGYLYVSIAINRALVEERIDCLPPLLNFPFSKKEILKQRKNEQNNDRATILLAVTHKIDAKLFRTLVEKFTADNIFLGNPYKIADEKTELGQQYLAAILEFDPWLKEIKNKVNFGSLHLVLDNCIRLIQANICYIPLVKQKLQEIPTNLDFTSDENTTRNNNHALRFASSLGAFFSLYLKLNPDLIDSYMETTIVYPHKQTIILLENTAEQIEERKKLIFNFAVIPNSKEQLEATNNGLIDIIKMLLKIPNKLSTFNDGVVTCIRENDSTSEKAYRFDCFSFALITGNYDIVQEMVEKGARIEEKHFCFAAFLGHAQILQFIIDNNHDYYFSESTDKRNPLEYAVLNKHTECVKVLVNSLLKDESYADSKNATINRYIRKAHKFCTAEQTKIRAFLESNFSSKELQDLQQKSTQRIEYTAEAIDTPSEENNNAVQIDEINNRDHRVKFKNPELQKDAVAFVEKDHWMATHTNPKQTEFEDSIQFMSQNSGRFGKRFFSVKTQLPDGTKEHILKMRLRGDKRLFFKPMTLDEVKAKYPMEEIKDNTVYYQSVLQEKHGGKFT